MPALSRLSRVFGTLTLALALSACQEQPPDKFAKLFPVQPLPDTLVFTISDADAVIASDTIPHPVFFRELPSDMYADIEYAVDSAYSTVLARGRFDLSPQYEMLWADIRYAWFQHQSLLLYDKKAKRITDRITVAELYGGESGQIITGAWLLNGQQIVQRQASYSTRLTETEEVERSVEHYVSLWKIEGGRFIEQPVQDTAKWIREFPMEEW